MNTKSKSLTHAALFTTLVLLIPLIAMQFSKDVVWTPLDFVAAGALLFATGLVYELVVSKMRDRKKKLIAGGVLLLAFLYLWAEMAVGIFTHLGS